MVNIHLLLLALNLSIFKCASIDDESIATVVCEQGVAIRHSVECVTGAYSTLDQCDAFSSLNFSSEILHLILEFVAKSPGKMAAVSRKLRFLVGEANKFRFYRGTCWDMPELANIWKFGNTNMKKEEAAFTIERDDILALRDAPSEQFFFEHISNLLINEGSFKELARPVLKYLVRTLYTGLSRDGSTDNFLKNRNNFLHYAINNRFYDVVFEIKKDRDLYESNSHLLNVIKDAGNYDYFSWVFDNRSAREYFLEIMSQMNPTTKDMLAWTAVCINRKAPESYYVQYLESKPELFHLAIEKYLDVFSPITLDPEEIQYYHALINGYIERYLRPSSLAASIICSVQLLNDVRYGPEDAELYRNCLVPFYNNSEISIFAIAASKANKKALVRQLSNSPGFNVIFSDPVAEIKSIHRVKVLFDIMEGTTLVHDDFINYANVYLKLAVLWNNFKFTSMTSASPIGIKFVIESPVEYVGLGFAPTYEFYAKNGNLVLTLKKMFNDAAESGPEEFEELVTRLCGQQGGNEPSVIFGADFAVSYKVIQLLLANVALISMLRNCHVRISCSSDPRISDESFAPFTDVIYKSD